MSSIWFRDPVDNSSVQLIADNVEFVADRYLELSREHGLTILEIYRMVRVALFGPAALEDKFNPFAELKKLQRELERDNALINSPLGSSLPTEELYAIWSRAYDAVRWCAEHSPDPATQARLRTFLAEQEAQMRGVLAKLMAKAKTKLKVVQ